MEKLKATPLDVESLGRLAADHELLAADAANTPSEREYFRQRAAIYRSRQYEILAGDVLEQPRPYPLASSLGEGPNTSRRPSIFRPLERGMRWRARLWMAILCGARDCGAAICIVTLLVTMRDAQTDQQTRGGDDSTARSGR